MIVVLYGTDDFSIDEEAQRLAAEAMPSDMADLNTTRLAADASVDDVRAAATTAPFLAPHRVARVEGLLSRLTQPPRRASGTSAGQPRQRKNTATKRAVDALAGFLPTVPAENRLIFAEPIAADRSNRRRPAPALSARAVGQGAEGACDGQGAAAPPGAGLGAVAAGARPAARRQHYAGRCRPARAGE